MFSLFWSVTLSPEGAFVHGLYMEGARWDLETNSINDSRLKELHPEMPVMFLRAVTQDKQERVNIYECPVYKTRERGQHWLLERKLWNWELYFQDQHISGPSTSRPETNRLNGSSRGWLCFSKFENLNNKLYLISTISTKYLLTYMLHAITYIKYILINIYIIFISSGFLSRWLAWMLLIVSSQYQYLTREPVTLLMTMSWVMREPAAST